MVIVTEVKMALSRGKPSLTKEQAEAIGIASDLAAANPGGAYELRPVGLFVPGSAAS